MFRHRLIAAAALAAWLLAWGSATLHVHVHSHDHSGCHLVATADQAATDLEAGSPGCQVHVHLGHSHHGSGHSHVRHVAPTVDQDQVVTIPAIGDESCPLCELLAIAFRPAEAVCLPVRDVCVETYRPSVRVVAISALPWYWQSRAPPVCS